MIKQIIRQESSSAGTRIIRLFEISGLLLFVLGVAAPTRIMTWSLIAAAAALLSPAVWRIIRANRQGPVGHLSIHPSQRSGSDVNQRFKVFTITLPSDVIRFSNFEQSFFQNLNDEDMWSTDQYLAFFGRYSKSLTLAIDSQSKSIVGGFDIWPVTPRLYEALRRGHIHEGHIVDTDILTAPGEHWWARAIMTDPNTRKTEPQLTPVVVESALANWRRNLGPTETLKIVTNVWTPCGARLAQQLGFAQLAHDEPPQPFALEGNREDVLARLDETFTHYEAERTQRRRAA